MAENPKNPNITDETPENSTEDEAVKHDHKKKIPSKVLFLSITIAAILLLGTGAWFVYKHFLTPHNTENKVAPEHLDDEKEKTPEINAFLSIPEVLVNLRSTKPKGNILRATFILQIYSKEDEPKIKEFLPIILDQLLSYLRDQTISDLEGPGLERMRQALLIRINNVIRPLKIHRVIIKDFIIQ